MAHNLSLIILSVSLLTFGWRRVLSYMRYFQQEEYNARRFIPWMKNNAAYDTRGTLIFGLIAAASFTLPGEIPSLILSIIAMVALLSVSYLKEEDPRSTGKIRLNMTERATKTAQLAFLFIAIGAFLPLTPILCTSCHGEHSLVSAALIGVVVVQLVPFSLIVSNALLSPLEKRVQAHYLNDARRILSDVNPFVIGITGSYGKTGAKAALGEILSQSLGCTFWPKKSINTVMGITRTIREQLKPHHKFAVIEMGAYNVGSIKRLCDLTPPKAALVTAVGIMHLERFGSPEAVYRAKSEIAQALPENGMLVVNGDSPNARRMAMEHKRGTTLLYGFDLSGGPLDCYATNVAFTESGTSFTLHFQGEKLEGKTPLLGRPALLNALGAFTMACALGADPHYAAACLGNLQPVDNRLVLDKGSKVSYLRDAYNSNPIGFESALEVLSSLPAKRRILMTPGMIELGSQQSEQNKRVARIAASVCDVVYIVGNTNREALLAGLSEANYPTTKIVQAESRDEAFRILAEQEQQGDLVLIENDLGDLHEGKVRF